MNLLLSNTLSNSTLEDKSNRIIFDLSSASEEIDIQNASIEDLSNLIVSKMMTSVKEDIASLPDRNHLQLAECS